MWRDAAAKRQRGKKNYKPPGTDKKTSRQDKRKNSRVSNDVNWSTRGGKGGQTGVNKI